MKLTAGLCQCGCGQTTRIARQTDTRRGDVKGQPRKFVRLTANMRDVLAAAAKQELRRPPHEGPGARPWPAAWQTLYSLVNRGLLEASVRKNRAGHELEVWTITDTGRQALQPPEIFRRERDVYLAHPNPDISGDYTTDPRRGRDELPVLDPDSLDSAWAQLSAERRAMTETPRARARRLARSARRAA
jgi:hypothetical protein